MRTRPALPCCTTSSRTTATATSLESLAQAGFPEPVLQALRLLTHADGVPYRDYVRALADDPIARKVKLADLRHNTDTRRVGGRRTPKHDLYLEAIRYLEELN